MGFSAHRLRHQHDGFCHPRQFRLAYQRGIGVYGLMASSSGLIIPLTIFLIGTRLWSLGKKHGYMTQVQYFRDRWECDGIGTVIFAVTALMMIPYVVIGMMGGGHTLNSLSDGWVPYWLGGAIVAVVVMLYVFSAECAAWRG